MSQPFPGQPPAPQATTSDVDGQISPSQAPAVNPAPATPAVQPTAPAPATPAQPQPRAAVPSQPQAPAQPTRQGLHSAIFDGVLKTLTWGRTPVYVNRTDPETGETSRVQVGRGPTLAQSILSGALAGLFAPGAASARDAEGRPNPAAALATGYQAGKAALARPQQQAQAQEDENLQRKQMTMAANISLIHQQMSNVMNGHTMLQATADANKAGVLADAKEYDKNLTGADANDPTKKAILGQGLDHQEALDMLKGNWSTRLAIVDGYKDHIDPATGQVTGSEPTYTLLSPSVTVKMNPAQVAAMAKFKPQYQDAATATGNNVAIPLNRYVTDVHQLNSLNQTEAYFENVKDQLGLKGTPDFAAIARQGGQPVLDAVKDVENSIAQGGTPVDALRRLSTTGGGALILRQLGITNQQVNDLWNKQQKEAALAKEGGVGSKAPMDDKTVSGLLTSLDQSNIPNEVKKTIRAGAQPDAQGHYNLNMQQGEDLRNRILTAQQNQTRDAIQSGDPTEMQKQVNLTIGAGDLTPAKDMYSARANVKATYNKQLEQRAIALGLDPNHYNIEALKAKSAAYDSYSASGKVGQQLNSFKTFGEHVGGAKDANDAWQRSGSPDINRTIAWWDQHASNDQNYQRFRASIIAPAKEYMSFLNQNRAEHEDDIRSLQKVLDENQTPESVFTALQTFAKTADERAWALGDTYLNTVGTTFPGLVSKATVDNFAKLGVPSKAAKVSGTLPRAQSWVANQQPQTLTKSPQDKAIAQRFYSASGGDMDRMRSIAKEHGYIIP